MVDRRSPSDVFLELWRARGLQTSEAFRECAEAWAQIRELEMMARIQPQAPLPPAAPAPPPAGEAAPESTPESTPKSTPDEGEKVHPERVESTPPEGVQNGPPARDNSEIGKKAYAARKANLRETMDRVRASGVSMQSIATAAGLTLNDVLDFIAARPLPLPKIARLEKGLGKFEEAGA